MQNLFDVSGKVVLVTGGSRGIGAMIAEGFVAAGARVYITARKAAECAETAERLSKIGPCVALPADLGQLADIDALATEFEARETRLDVLVNNAGAVWAAPFGQMDEKAWDKVMDINLKAAFFLTQRLGPLLSAAASAEDPARVINVGSADGLKIPPLETFAYSASKAGVHHLTRHLAARLGPDNITVNALAPGPFESKMMAVTLERFGDDIRASNPRRRIGSPEDIAGAAIFLASRAGAYVNGAVIPVDGGQTSCT